MSAPNPAALLARNAIDVLPAPDGWSWTVCSDLRYTQACRDGVPTLYLEYHTGDDDLEMVYLVGVHDLAPDPAP